MTMHELRPLPREPKLSVSGEREVGAIVADMWENGEKLVRQELALGLAELQLRTDKLKSSLLEGAIIGAIYNAGVLVLLAAIVLGLSEVMAPWLAALLVGVATFGAGYVLQQRAKQQATEAVAEVNDSQTVEAMKEGIR
ncbi:MAG TPA: phage holin family protein [Polyangiales bacterium]|nr:phage holin family protein [Polyangiales bacterium]